MPTDNNTTATATAADDNKALYLIFYGYENSFRCYAKNAIDAMVQLFEYTGDCSLFTTQELREMGERYGLSKLIKLFEHCSETIESIGVYTPLYELNKEAK